jgi:hypothetical protein
MAANSCLLAVQTAVYAVLSGDATLATLVGGVANIQNYEPEEPPTEFVFVGNAIERAYNTMGGNVVGFGWEVQLTVHIYSYYKGDINALNILNRVTTLLNQQPPTVAGYSKVMCAYGDPVTRVHIETKDKQERRHIPALFTITVRE